VNTLITAGLSGVKTIFVYIDTCFSGYLQGLNSTTIQTPPRGKLWGFAASRVDEKSYEYPELDKGHGVFTWFLNQVLTASVPEPSKVSTIRDATRYVRDSVVDYTKKRSHQQHPVEFGNFEDDTPLFDVTVETPKTAPAVPSAAALGDDAGPWGRGFNERDPRLEYELEGERIVSRYLDGEASPLIKADFERAADNFDEARKLAPESVWLESRSAFSHGRALIFDRRYDEAIRLLDQAIRLDPAGAISYNALGIAYLEQSEYPKALAAFEDAVSRAPLWAYAWHNKALAESQMGNYRAAIKSYQRGIEVAPQYFYLPYNLGALYQGLNRLREAEAQYRKAAKVDATKGEPYNALGTIRAIQGKRKEARRFFEESLRLDPTLELARRNLAAL
jgi:Flp pilus assembly protein TadD